LTGLREISTLREVTDMSATSTSRALRPTIATVSSDARELEVLRAFQRGDEAAVWIIYQRYSGLVHSVAMQVLRRRVLAEEAVQQTFVQAWRAAATLDTERDVAPWLATIGRRVAIDIARREGRRPSTSLEGADPGDAALVTLPPSESASWEAAQVRLAVEALHPDERQIARLQHLEGFTHQEIADMLSLPLGTVKSRSFRAHRSLATRLAHLRADDE
jgi:RNA polymerase sigma-70 factor (ECF subfamily)